MVSFDGIHEIDSTGWVNFSKLDEETKQRSNQKRSDVDLAPPRLSLPLKHYCMIAEKVFISFLKSYRSLYVNDSVPSREKVTVLGKRLQAFLSVVLPSHSGFALVEHEKENLRIKDMTSQLAEYLDRVQDIETSANQDCSKETRDDCESRPTLESVEHLDESRTFSESSESSSFCGSNNSIFGGIISVSDGSNDEERPKPVVEHTFCSSKLLALGGSRDTVKVNENGEQYEVIHTSTAKKEPSTDDLSVSLTETSGFGTSIVWDTSSLSIHGQIGEFYSNECRDGSIHLPDIEPATTSDTSDVSVDFSAGDGSWRTDDSNSCETNFESLMKHWKEKEKGSSDKSWNEERNNAL